MGYGALAIAQSSMAIDILALYLTFSMWATTLRESRKMHAERLAVELPLLLQSTQLLNCGA